MALRRTVSEQERRKTENTQNSQLGKQRGKVVTILSRKERLLGFAGLYLEKAQFQAGCLKRGIQWEVRTQETQHKAFDEEISEVIRDW